MDGKLLFKNLVMDLLEEVRSILYTHVKLGTLSFTS